MCETSRTLSADAAGRYLVAFPDLSGAVDALANLRGGERLLMDLYEHRDDLIAAAGRTVEAWESVFRALYETVVGLGAGACSWLHVWSERPYTVPTCDFNYMISPKDFREVCMPSLAEQARRAGRCLFHLDGEGAARHAEALAAEPAITAIQYTAEATTGSALAIIDALRRFQAAGKPLWIDCRPDEFPPLIERLDPRGLALCPRGLASPRDAEPLLRLVGA